MSRPILSITLSFGLVSLPVRLFTATLSKRVTFHLLDRATGQRVRQQLVSTTPPSRDGEDEATDRLPRKTSTTTGRAGGSPRIAVVPDEDAQSDRRPADAARVVPRQELVKGYEIGRDQHIEITAEELKTLESEANQHAEIQEFVALSQVDPVYFEKAYYLGPDKGAEKVYRLFARALREQQQGAIAKLVMRGKEKLVLVRPTHQDRLMLHTLYYADEVRDRSEISVPEVQLTEAEVRLAEQVISSRTAEAWEPERYHDTYRERVLGLIEEKRQGKATRTSAADSPRPVIDLMEALRQSLVTAGKRPARGQSPAPSRSSKAKRTG